MERPGTNDTRTETLAAMKTTLLGTINSTLAACRKRGDYTAGGQDKPLSYHLEQLRTAIEQEDMDTIRLYGRNAAHWFPYSNSVEMYIQEIGS